MEIERPSWLTKEYLKNALEHGNNYTVTIQDFKVNMAVPKGTNFVCNVYRVSIEYVNSNNEEKLEKISLIVKEPIYGPTYESVTKFTIENEVKFYKTLALKLNSLSEVKGSNNFSEAKEILPKSYISTEKNVIILEDLKPKGFVIADRALRCDYIHCVAALKALAKFHAGVKVVIEKEPEIIELYKVLWDCDEMKKSLGPLFQANFKNLADELKNHSELAKYSSWLYENYETGLDRAFKLMDPKENEFNVIIHNDFGLHNLLFKYKDSIPENVLLIDFQCCRYTSPVIDFFYFVELSVQEDIREQKFDELVHLYVTELNYNLEKYGSNSKLEESDFRRCIEERSYLRVSYTVAFLALTICLPTAAESEIFELDDLKKQEINKSGTNAFQNYVKNEKFIKIITKRFDKFEKMGLIKLKT